ncbi:hypothetical protein TNCV_4451951 [Trichonephila clavipes]|nr:hypothetical protein TNCV_4451951 [Trichonephila clavipes]
MTRPSCEENETPLKFSHSEENMETLENKSNTLDEKLKKSDPLKDKGTIFFPTRKSCSFDKAWERVTLFGGVKRRIHQIPSVVNNNRADVKITVVTLGTGDLPSQAMHNVAPISAVPFCVTHNPNITANSSHKNHVVTEEAQTRTELWEGTDAHALSRTTAQRCRIACSGASLIAFLPHHIDPSGHGYDLMVSVVVSRVLVLMLLKIRCAVGLMHVKSVVTQSSPVGRVWKFGEGAPAGEGRSGEKDEKSPGERTDGRRTGRDERRRQERRRKKRAESGIGVKKMMNAGGVENGI